MLVTLCQSTGDGDYYAHGPRSRRRDPMLELSQSQSGELIINKNIAVVGPGANLLAVARGEKLISDQFGNVEASRERISFVREQRIHFCTVTSLQDLHDAEVKIRHDLA
jgi:hypothetical protein